MPVYLFVSFEAFSKLVHLTLKLGWMDEVNAYASPPLIISQKAELTGSRLGTAEIQHCFVQTQCVASFAYHGHSTNPTHAALYEELHVP